MPFNTWTDDIRGNLWGPEANIWSWRAETNSLLNTLKHIHYHHMSSQHTQIA